MLVKQQLLSHLSFNTQELQHELFSTLTCTILLAGYLALPETINAQSFLYGSDQSGFLTLINTLTGAGTVIGQETNFPLSTEIEFGMGQLYSDETNGNTNLHTVSTSTGLSTGFVSHGLAAFNGMEFVGSTLYVTNNPGTSLSQLEIVNPVTGAQTVIGATGLGPISGLAYDGTTMYGVTGGGGAGQLVTINLLTGVATPGPILTELVSGNPLDRVGSIEFGTDGVLYGGLGLRASSNAGWLFSINTTTGGSTLIGPTGLGGITGLASVPEPTSVGLLAMGVAGLLFRRRRTI